MRSQRLVTIDSWRYINIRYVCMYVCMDGWMDGWMDVCMYVCMYTATQNTAKLVFCDVIN